MKDRINGYIAILLVTIAGAGAASIIIHVAFNNTFEVAQNKNAASYAALQQSILDSRPDGTPQP